MEQIKSRFYNYLIVYTKKQININTTSYFPSEYFKFGYIVVIRIGVSESHFVYFGI